MIQDMDYRLRLARTHARLQQKEVAERCHIKRANISSYENGLNAPSLDNLKKLAILYGVTSDYLLDIDSEPKMPLAGLTEDQIEAMYAVRASFLKKNTDDAAES